MLIVVFAMLRWTRVLSAGMVAWGWAHGAVDLNLQCPYVQMMAELDDSAKGCD
jgi:hypothetical protein